MVDSTYRELVTYGRDAVFQQGDRIVFARRSDARLIVLALYCVGLPIGVVAGSPDGGALMFAIALASGVLLACIVLAQIAPLGYRYAMFTIDTRARVLLNAKGQLVAPLTDVQIRANPDTGLHVTCSTDEAGVRWGHGDLADTATVLRSLGIDVA